MPDLNLANAGKTWTPEMRQQLRESFDDGCSLEVLQHIAGRTSGAVVGKLMQMNLLIQDRNGFYYRVNPDPWCSYHDVRHIDKGARGA
jgi:hypothetical protein